MAGATLNVPAPPPRNTYYPNNAYVVARIRTDEGTEDLGYTMLVGADGRARCARTFRTTSRRG